MTHLLKPEAAALYKSLEGQPTRSSQTAESLRASIGTRSLYGPTTPEGLKKVYDIQVPGPLGDVPCRIYQPSAPGPHPVILYFHGGGFVIGGNINHAAVAAHYCVICKAVVVAVDYRLAPEHAFPAAVQDSWAVTEWAAEHTEDLGGNGKMIAAGESAGGNLSAVMALIGKENGKQLLSGQVIICPALSTKMDTPSYKEFEFDTFESKKDIEWFYNHYLQGQDGSHPHFCPFNAESLLGLPPALVLTAEVDVLRDEGESYGAALAAAGIPVTMRRCLGHYHNSMLNVGMFGEHAKDTYREVAAWMASVLPVVEE